METKIEISFYLWIEYGLSKGDVLRLDKSTPDNNGNQQICAWFEKTKEIFVSHGNYALALENLDSMIQEKFQKRSFLKSILDLPFNTIIGILAHFRYKEYAHKNTIVEDFLHRHEDAMVRIKKDGKQLVAVWEAKPINKFDDYISEQSLVADNLKPKIPTNVMYHIFRTKTFNEMFQLMINTHHYKGDNYYHQSDSLWFFLSHRNFEITNSYLFR